MPENKDDELYRAIHSGEWNKARELLRGKSCREKVEYVDRHGFNTLHIACMNIRMVPADIIESLISISPEALLKLDMDGNTPLHVAMVDLQWFQETIDDVHGRDTVLHHDNLFYETGSILLDACPRAATIVSHSGDTPLHYAIEFDVPPKAFKPLVAANPSAVTLCDNSGSTPINMFFEYWNIGMRQALDCCDEDKNDIFNVSIKHSHNMTNRILHEVYDIAIQLFQGKHQGRHPMTYLDAAKGAITDVSCPWSIFNIMLKRQPLIAYDYDDDGDCLFHSAARSKSSLDGNLYRCSECEQKIGSVSPWGLDLISWHRLCLECLRKEEEDGNPNLYKINSVDKIPAIMNDLINMSSHVAMVPNHDGRLPFHLAIETSSSLDDDRMKIIFEAEPLAMETMDISNHMYPFMISAVNSLGQTSMLQNFTFCYELLIENPTLVICGKRNRDV